MAGSFRVVRCLPSVAELIFPERFTEWTEEYSGHWLHRHRLLVDSVEVGLSRSFALVGVGPSDEACAFLLCEVPDADAAAYAGAWISYVWTAPGHRGRGMAGSLLEEAIATTRRTTRSWSLCSVRSHQAPVTNLYARYGFSSLGPRTSVMTRPGPQRPALPTGPVGGEASDGVLHAFPLRASDTGFVAEIVARDHVEVRRDDVITCSGVADPEELLSETVFGADAGVGVVFRWASQVWLGWSTAGSFRLRCTSPGPGDSAVAEAVDMVRQSTEFRAVTAARYLPPRY